MYLRKGPWYHKEAVYLRMRSPVRTPPCGALPKGRAHLARALVLLSLLGELLYGSDLLLLQSLGSHPPCYNLGHAQCYGHGTVVTAHLSGKQNMPA